MDTGFEAALGAAGAFWAETLRREVIIDLPRDQAAEIVLGACGLLAGASLPTLAAATVAAAASQGGTAMTTAIASAGTSAAAKILGACTLAAVSVGGAAAVTGHLPDGAQRVVADAGTRIGLNLPRPGTAGVGVGAATSNWVWAGDAGSVTVGLDADAGLVLGGVEAAIGFDADVRVDTAARVVVDFVSADERVSVTLTERDGRVHASVDVLGSAATSITGTEGAVGGGASADAGISTGSTSGGSIVPQLGLLGGSCGCSEPESRESDVRSLPPKPVEDEAGDPDPNVGVDAGASVTVGVSGEAESGSCGCDASDGGSVGVDAGADAGVGIGIQLGG